MGCTEEVALEQALEGWRGGGQVVLWEQYAGRRNSTSKGIWKLALIPEVAQTGWAQRLWKGIEEDKIRKCKADLSLVCGLWIVGSHGRYCKGVINSVTIILPIFCISS